MRCLVFSPDALLLFLRPDHRAKIWPQISPHLWCARSFASNCLSFPFLSIHHFRPILSPLHYCADHTRRSDSFVSVFWDGSTIQNNLQQPPADLQMLRSLPNNLPCDQHTVLPIGYCSETKMSRASLLDARLPAVHPQWLGWLLVSAAIFNLQLQRCASTCGLPPDEHTRTPHSLTGLPQSGCSHRALAKRQFTRTDAGNRNWREELL